MSREPDLFDSAGVVSAPKPTATLIAWPIDRDVGRVRHIARLVLAKDDRQRETYWRTTCNRLGSVLLRHGLDEAEVLRQLDRLGHAVSLEMQRQQLAAARQQPGGAR